MLQTIGHISFPKSLFLPTMGSGVGGRDWREEGGCFGPYTAFVLSVMLRAGLGSRNASASFRACVVAGTSEAEGELEEQELCKYCVLLALLAFVLMLVLSCRLRTRKLVL